MSEKPSSITNALRTLVALVVVSGVAVVLTWWQLDEVIRTWAKGNPSAQEILATGGIEALRDEAIVPKFVPLAVVSFVVLALLLLVLGAFLSHGHGWARLVLAATSVFGVLVAMLGLSHDLPMSFVVISVLFCLLSVALIYFMWQRETSAYLRVD